MMGRSPVGPSRLLSFLAIGLLLAVTAAGTALSAQDRPGYTARPTQDGGIGRSSVLFTHAIESGNVLVDAVEIFNLADAPTLFDVYVVDMVPLADGSLSPAARASSVEGAGAWFDVSVDTVEVPPRSTAEVDFTVAVPDGTPPGDYTAAVIVEPHEASTGGTISIRTRLGFPAQITVLAEINLGVTLGSVSTRTTDDGIEIAMPISNTGDVTFSSAGIAELEGWSGDGITLQMSPEGAFIAPGEQMQMTALWEDPPLIGRYGVTVTVDAVVGDRQPVQFVSSTTTFWLVPWSVITILVVAAAIAAWVVRATRRSRRRRSLRKLEERELLRELRSRPQS